MFNSHIYSFWDEAPDLQKLFNLNQAFVFVGKNKIGYGYIFRGRHLILIHSRLAEDQRPKTKLHSKASHHDVVTITRATYLKFCGTKHKHLF